MVIMRMTTATRRRTLRRNTTGRKYVVNAKNQERNSRREVRKKRRERKKKMREMKERLRCRGRKKRERERLTVRNLCFGVLCVCRCSG